MQATKDSFYITLRDRLVAIDPNRTIMLDGATRPAIVVVENEPPGTPPTLCDAFYLYWGAARPARPEAGTLMEMECGISYRTKGSDTNGNLDRGRDLGSLDNDMLAMCSPPNTEKCDYSTGTDVDLGSTIFWTQPVFSALVNAPPYVGREVSITVFFYPEVNQT